ncbi:MAG: M48 family metallopeptidase [Bacteroidales bacterium]|nr:M48 family metallopeptidase [Bacteroidales bacterium]
MKTFIINGRTLNCEIKRSRRKTVALYVYPDKRIEIRTPLLYNINDVEPFLIKHSRWLFNRLDSKNDNVNLPKTFTDGEAHYFLGKQYPIKVNISSRNSVIFKDEVIVISAKSQELVEALLDRWYFEQARRVFQEISVPLIKQMEKYDVAPKSFAIRKMKTRWGSCSRRGSISLNLHLIKLPEQCIKEVILHELCHLVHFNHSKEFYALMTAEMPDWKIWKKELKFV